MRLYDKKTERDIQKLLNGVLLGTFACIVLYTAFGFLLVRIHADMLASKMHLFLLIDMAAVVRPDDPYLVSPLHQLGSALLFGLFLGTLMALLTSSLSLVPWRRGSWNKTIDPLCAALLIPVYLYFMFSKEMPILSLLWGILTPLFFWTPWIWAVKRTGGRHRHPLRIVLFALLFLLPLHPLKDMSLTGIRDTMIENPIGKWTSDFYYDHTLLAAHVIKPAPHQTQKVIALSPDVAVSGRLPAGSLWIRRDDPCTLRGSSVVISTRPLDCSSFVVSDTESALPAQELLRQASALFDNNKAVRRGVKWFLKVGFWATLLLLVLWVATLGDDIYRRHRGIAALLVLCSLLLAARGVYGDYLLRSLRADPNRRVHEYVRSSSPKKRYLVSIHYPDHLTEEELVAIAKDPRPRVRHAAFLAIGQRLDATYLSALRDGMADPEQIVRTKACHALGEIGNEDALRILDQAIANDPSWYVRDYAYWAKCKVSPVFKMVDTPERSRTPP